MIEMMGASEQLVENLQWVSSQLNKLLGLSKSRAYQQDVQNLPLTRLSQTPYGVRSYVTAGTGQSTVVFESGMGQGKEVWASVFRVVSKVARVVAYDRAGYGQSEASALARDGVQIVQELRAMLQAENLPAPYILVGHSLGGTVVKLFAQMYPDEVAGVVLVDARHADFVQRCRDIGLLRLLYEPPLDLFLLGRSAMRSELAAAPTTMEQTRSAGFFPNIPLMVLTHRRRAFHWGRGVARVWAESQRSLAGLSAKGLIKVCERSGHHVHRDRPDLVGRAVLAVVAQAQKSRTEKYC
jgi:pimeloyl-ACP methyl ester carboxylesterase